VDETLTGSSRHNRHDERGLPRYNSVGCSCSPKNPPCRRASTIEHVRRTPRRGGRPVAATREEENRWALHPRHAGAAVCRSAGGWAAREETDAADQGGRRGTPSPPLVINRGGARAMAPSPPMVDGCRNGAGRHSHAPERASCHRTAQGCGGGANAVYEWKPPPRRPQRRRRKAATHGGVPRAVAVTDVAYSPERSRRKTHERAPRAWRHGRRPTGKGAGATDRGGAAAITTVGRPPDTTGACVAHAPPSKNKGGAGYRTNHHSSQNTGDSDGYGQ